MDMARASDVLRTHSVVTCTDADEERGPTASKRRRSGAHASGRLAARVWIFMAFAGSVRGALLKGQRAFIFECP